MFVKGISKKKRSCQPVCHIPSPPPKLRCSVFWAQTSHGVAAHLYLTVQGLHRSAHVAHMQRTRTVSWRLQALGLENVPTNSAKIKLGCLKAGDETGHSSITVALMKAETEAQHLQPRRESTALSIKIPACFQLARLSSAKKLSR